MKNATGRLLITFLSDKQIYSLKRTLQRNQFTEIEPFFQKIFGVEAISKNHFLQCIAVTLSSQIKGSL